MSSPLGCFRTLAVNHSLKTSIKRLLFNKNILHFSREPLFSCCQCIHPLWTHNHLVLTGIRCLHVHGHMWLCNQFCTYLHQCACVWVWLPSMDGNLFWKGGNVTGFAVLFCLFLSREACVSLCSYTGRAESLLMSMTSTFSGYKTMCMVHVHAPC